MEIELQLLIDGANREKLLQLPLLEKWAAAEPTQSDLRAVYFDTPDLYLRRQDTGLRVRESGSEKIQTLKVGGSVRSGLHSRHEWEMPVEAAQPDLVPLREALAPHREWSCLLSSPSLAERLLPLFSVRVRRLAWDLRIDGDIIELVLDEGVIEHDGNTMPVSEIELKSGTPCRVYELALQLLEEIPLRVGTQSKAARGYALRFPSDTGAVKARPVALPAHCSTAEGLQAIVESLHQMRVGVRRLRSALKLFEPVIPCPPDLREEFRWLGNQRGNQLGSARDWDVLTTSTLDFIEERVAGDMPLETVRQLASSIAQEQRADTAKVILSPRYTRLFLSLGAWMQSLESKESSSGGAARLAKFARKCIDRGHREIQATRPAYHPRRCGSSAPAADRVQAKPLCDRVFPGAVSGQARAPLCCRAVGHAGQTGPASRYVGGRWLAAAIANGDRAAASPCGGGLRQRLLRGAPVDDACGLAQGLEEILRG